MTEETIMTREQALAEFTRLVDLSENEDQDEMDEEEIDERLADLRQWARQQSLVFSYDEPTDTFSLQEADEDTKATWQHERILHRYAGLIGTFMLEDRAAETHGDPITLTTTSLVGILPRKEGEPRTWLVHLDAIAEAYGGEYTYPVELYVTVTPQAEGHPIVEEATDAQVASFAVE